MTLADIDLFELNEAFASVVLRYMQAFDIDHDKINVNGGAIAMGHPLGATGAMILGTVLDELERRDLIDRAGDAVHRRRHGHGDDHRAGVMRARQPDCPGSAHLAKAFMPKIDIQRSDRHRHGLSGAVPPGRRRTAAKAARQCGRASTSSASTSTTLKPGACVVAAPLARERGRVRLRARGRGRAVRGRRRDRAQAGRRRRLEGGRRRTAIA